MPQSSLAPARPGPGLAGSRSRVSPGPESGQRLGGASILLAVILTAQLMVVLDATIVNVALPHIQKSLGFSSSALSWVINAYILTFGGFLLLGARAGDLFGRRRVFLIGIAVFTLSSLVGGLAVSGWALLGARAVQGMGAALAAPCALSLLTTAFPEGQQRVRAIGLYTTVSAAGGATGLVAGGLLTQLVSWRWVMFVNVPIGLGVWLLGRAVIAETERQNGHFDLIGALTCTVGVSGVVLGLVEAGSMGWTSPVSLVALFGGVAVFAYFLHHESRVSEPILPLRLLAHATRNSANVSRALLYAGFYGLFYFLAQFLQDVQGYSPLRAGLAFLPMPVSVFLASQLASRRLLRHLPEKAVMILGNSIAIVGLLLATRVGSASPYSQIVLCLVLIGAGSGMTLVALTSASLADVGARDRRRRVRARERVATARCGSWSRRTGDHLQLAGRARQTRPGCDRVGISPLSRRRVRRRRTLCRGCPGNSGVRRSAVLRSPATRTRGGLVGRAANWRADSASKWPSSLPTKDCSRRVLVPATSASRQASRPLELRCRASPASQAPLTSRKVLIQ